LSHVFNCVIYKISKGRIVVNDGSDFVCLEVRSYNISRETWQRIASSRHFDQEAYTPNTSNLQEAPIGLLSVGYS
jgi:hypothetical protein